MKKFRKENEVDDLDLDNLEVKEVIEEKKDTKTKIPKILLNIIFQKKSVITSQRL